MEKADSITLVLASVRRNCAGTRKRCTVRVSSMPSSRLRAALAFSSISSRCSRSSARLASAYSEETLPVHRLRVPAQLRRTLASTNVIESAFSIVETVCRNVKRWRPGDHIERWVGSGLLVAERQFRKVQGYRQIPALLTALALAVSKKSVA